MPTYEYRCPEGHEFERVQKITDSARIRCPECGRLAQRQISGGAGLIFKGSGFYITDYGKDGKGPSTRSEGEPKAESAKAETGKGEKEAAAPNPEKSPPTEPGKSSGKKSSRKKASS